MSLALGWGPSACSNDEPEYQFWDEVADPVGDDQPTSVPIGPRGTGGSGQAHLGSGTIKSYFDERRRLSPPSPPIPSSLTGFPWAFLTD
jgi:hypothetical protein